jgi:hypothetical protein
MNWQGLFARLVFEWQHVFCLVKFLNKDTRDLMKERFED